MMALQLVGVGWYVAVCIVFGLLGGLWLDGRVGTTPLFTLLGLLLGVALTFYGVYKMVVPLMNGGQGSQNGKDQEQYPDDEL